MSGADPLTAAQERALRALWAEKALARVATVTPEGDPHIVPIWWDLVDGRVRIVTTRNSKKVRNLEANPRIAVTIDVDSMPYHGVRLAGEASLHKLGMADSILRLSVHFWDEEKGRPFAEGWIADAEQTSVVIEVLPDSVHVFREEG